MTHETEIVGRIRLKRDVASEQPLLSMGVGSAVAAGEYPCTMNQNGAVCAVKRDGVLFGVKPDEFEFVAITKPLTNRQRGAWLMLDVDLDAFRTPSSSSETAEAGSRIEPVQTVLGIPRRHMLDLLTGAERAIWEAMKVCEDTLPTDPLETEAVALLGKARNTVADLVDREIRAGRMPMPLCAGDDPPTSPTGADR